MALRSSKRASANPTLLVDSAVVDWIHANVLSKEVIAAPLTALLPICRHRASAEPR